MTEREKLIELLLKVDYALDTDGRKARDSAEFIADYLLSNGVIVPSVMPGQAVYIVDSAIYGIIEGKITHLEFNTYTTPMEWITVAGNYPWLGELEDKNRIDLLLGKTVFLTKEEAEKALKERSEEE